MAVVVSIARGHDPSYPFKTTGAAEGPVITGQCEAGYYLSAVEKGGEPAGSRPFGLEWAYRSVSKGRVIAGFPEKPIARFSSRRAQITKTTLALAEAYEKDRGHAADQRPLASIRQFANASTRRAGNSRKRKNVRSWPPVSRMRKSHAPRGPAQTWSTASSSTCPTTRSAGTRSTSGSSRKTSPAERWRERLGKEVCRLDAPAWPRVPETLRRADGESVYRAHGGELYATRAQLCMEEQLLVDAQPEGAPHLSRDRSAALLGADLGQLQTQLHAGAAGG